LGPRIVELAGEHASDEFRADVAHSVEAAHRHGAFLQLVSARVSSALADAGIRSAPLKGPMLGERIYGDPGRRLSSDVDLLIAPEELLAAVDAVINLGYSAPNDYVARGELPMLHFALPHERGELPPVELHWRVHWYERRFAHERLLPPMGAAPGWHPPPADELAALLLFYARDGFVDLRLAADLAAWWDVFGDRLETARLVELLSAYPALERVLTVALRVAERTVGLPLAQRLRATPKLGLRGRLAVRLANPNPRASPSQLYADMGVIDGLLMPPGELGLFVKRNVLLPREVLADLDRRAPKRRPRASLSRGAGVLARYGLTMTRLLRPPERLG
jgi:hypothetical protein